MLRRGNGGSDYAGAYHGQRPRHGNPNRNRCSFAPPIPFPPIWTSLKGRVHQGKHPASHVQAAL